MIHCVLANPCIDIVYPLDDFEPGKTYLDIAARSYPAGKGLNVARVLGTLEERAVVAGIMPAESRAFFIRRLEREGIAHAWYPAEGGARLNATVADRKNGRITHLNSSGAPVPPGTEAAFLSFLLARIGPGDLCVFSGGLPGGFSDDFYRTAVLECAGIGCETVLDARGACLKLGIRARPTIVKPNIEELESCFEEKINGVRHIALKGKRLLDMGIEYAFISLGDDGMIALHENDCLLCSPPPSRAVDTVGCGDAMVAGIAAARERRFSFNETCRLAVACGVSNAMHPGPGIVDRGDVYRIMEDVRIEAI